MLTVAICDDEYRFRKDIEKCCRQYFTEKDIEYELLEYNAGETFLAAQPPDIVVLDVTMPRLSGFLIKDILAKMHAKTRILFVSENKNVIADAFGKNVFGFLIKPINFPMFCEKMDMMIEDIRDCEQYVYCKSEGQIEQVYLKSILYIESYGRYTKLHVLGARTCGVSDVGFRKWLELLPEYYVQCGKSYIVNSHYIVRAEYELEMINGDRIPLEDRYKKTVFCKCASFGGKSDAVCRNV